jgi:hypothetical protein
MKGLFWKETEKRKIIDVLFFTFLKSSHFDSCSHMRLPWTQKLLFFLLLALNYNIFSYLEPHLDSSSRIFNLESLSCIKSSYEELFVLCMWAWF